MSTFRHRSWSLKPSAQTGIKTPELMYGTSDVAGQSEPAEQLVNPESKPA